MSEKLDQKIFTEDAQKVSQDGASEDVTNDSRMGARRHV